MEKLTVWVEVTGFQSRICAIGQGLPDFLGGAPVPLFHQTFHRGVGGAEVSFSIFPTGVAGKRVQYVVGNILPNVLKG